MAFNESFLSVNNISTACAGQLFIEGVESTLTQFKTVERVRYAVAGEPADFYDFLQLTCPPPCGARAFQD